MSPQLLSGAKSIPGRGFIILASLLRVVCVINGIAFFGIRNIWGLRGIRILVGRHISIASTILLPFSFHLLKKFSIFIFFQF